MRALRVDRLTLAALGATLQIHQDIERARHEIPVLRLLEISLDHLRRRAGYLVERIGAIDGIAEVRVVSSQAFIGGGSVPTHGIVSIAIQITGEEISAGELAVRLRTGARCVVARVQDNAVCCDLRTVFDDEDERLIEAIGEAIGARA